MNRSKESPNKINEKLYMRWYYLGLLKDYSTYFPVLIFLPIAIMMFFPKQMSPLVTSFVFALGIMVFICLYLIAFYPALIFGTKRLAEIYRGTSTYLAQNASRELDQNDLLQSSLMLSELLGSLYDYLGQSFFKLAKVRYTRNKLLGINPLLIKKKYVLKYVQTNGQLGELKITLGQLVTALETAQNVDYRIIQNFLTSISNKIETSFVSEKKQTFEESLKYAALFTQVFVLLFSKLVS